MKCNNSILRYWSMRIALAMGVMILLANAIALDKCVMEKALLCLGMGAMGLLGDCLFDGLKPAKRNNHRVNKKAA